MSEPGSSAGSQQPFPQLDTPVVNPDLTLSRPWYRFLISQWQKLGGGGSVTPTSAYLQLDGPDAEPPIGVYRATDNALVGEILTGALPEGEIYIGDSTGKAVAQTLHGDATLDQFGKITVLGEGGHPFGPFATGTDAANLTGHLPPSFFAAPSKLVSLVASPGVAFTSARSDAGWALDQGISPTWTGTHTFSNQIILSNGSATVPSWAVNGTNNGMYYDATNVALGVTIAGLEVAFFSATGLTVQHVGGSSSVLLISEAATAIIAARYSTNANPPQVSGRKARGTIALPLVVAQNDIALQQVGSAWDGSATFQNVANVQYTVIEPTPGPTAMGGQLRFLCTQLGTITGQEVARLEFGTGLSMFGANPVIDQNRTLIPGSSTVAGLPAIVTSGLRNVSDLEGGQGTVFGGNTLWRNQQNGQVAQSAVSGSGVLSKMTGYFNFAQRAIVNNTMQKLSDAGLLSKLLGLWVHAVPTNSADALLNWITPGTRALLNSGAIPWVASQGFTGDGAHILDSVATVATFGGSQNNFSMGCYVRTAGTGSAKAVIGQSSASARGFYLQSFTSGALIARLMDGTNDNYTPPQYTGMFVLSRGAAANYQASVNDAANATITRTSTAVTNRAISFLGTTDTTGSEFSNAQISFSFLGLALSTTDIANLRWILVDYYLVQMGALAADYTVAALPLPGTPPKGSKVFVTDGLAPVFAAAVAGAGAIYTPVYTDLTTWRCG